MDNQPQPSKKRIWAISEYYHPNFSGAAIQAHRVLDRLSNDTYCVHVLTTADQAARNLAGIRRSFGRVTIHYVRVLRRRNWNWLKAISVLQSFAVNMNRLARDCSFNVRLALFLWKKGRPGDIIQFYVVGEFSLMVMWIARWRKMHSVIQVSLMGADDPSSFQRSFLGLSTRTKLASFFVADRVIGLSTALTDSCRRSGIDADKIVRIPNGVDTNLFKPADRKTSQTRPKLGLCPNRLYIIFVGSAIIRKGIDVVVPAFMRVANEREDVDMLIVGPCDFSDRTRHPDSRRQVVDDLKRQLENCGLQDRVKWVGQVENVNEYLAASNVFFFPTRREGLPNALAEAMAAGLPSVVSKVDGVTTDLIRHGTDGLLIEDNDPASYAKALAGLLADPAQREAMGISARQRIERAFGLDAIVRRYLDLYQQIAGRCDDRS